MPALNSPFFLGKLERIWDWKGAGLVISVYFTKTILFLKNLIINVKVCKGEIMKKRYNVMLDEEAVKIVQAWLKPKGIAFSGYINSLLVENVEAIKVLEDVNDLKDVSIGQLTRIYANMATEIEKSKKEKKKKK